MMLTNDDNITDVAGEAIQTITQSDIVQSDVSLVHDDYDGGISLQKKISPVLLSKIKQSIDFDCGDGDNQNESLRRLASNTLIKKSKNF